jgi:hypothetical protein
MAKSAIVTGMVILSNPNGTASDYALYALDDFDGRLYAAGWLNGDNSSPSNPDGVGLDRVYVSSSSTLDDFTQLKWTNGQSPGTWNDANGQAMLYDETANSGTDTYSLWTYYGPGQPLAGSCNLYYQVNDPTVVGSGLNLVMFMTAVPCQNEYPAAADANGDPNFQVGWSTIGYATSSDGGATWTWKGTVPQLCSDGTPLLAPVTQGFPTDPTATYNIFAGGNGCPTAKFYNGGLYLWYTHFNDADPLPTGVPLLTLSIENGQGVWDKAQTCRLVTSAGTANLFVIGPDVAVANDGSGTLWMVAQQWGGPESGDLKLYYSSTADGAYQGVNWHPWDGADGVLVVATNPAYGGLFDLVTPAIGSVGNGTLSIYYSAPTVLTPTPVPNHWEQVNETFVLPCFAGGTRLLTSRGEVAVEELRAGDLMPTIRGGHLARVCWIGHRHVDLRGHPRPWDVHPVRVRAHAFGRGQPSRDLWLSPDHAVCVDGVLMPVRYLLNSATVVQEAAERITYWHVELEAHDVLLAEGLACESYLDTGNRSAFACATPQPAAWCVPGRVPR